MYPPLSTVTLNRTTDGGGKVQIQVDLLHYVTRVLTPQLDDPLQPRCCHLCLSVCCAKLKKGEGAHIRSYLLLHHHDFFAVCVAALATPRRQADLATLKTRLEDNQARCPNTEWHPFVQPQPVGEPLELFLTGLIACVSGAIRTVKSKGWFKAQARKGIWPMSPEQLVPFGAHTSVASYVSWCHTLLSPFVVPFLLLLLDVASFIVIPALLAPPQKDVLMQTLLVMLRGPPDESAADDDRASIWMLPADSPDVLRPQQAAAMLFHVMLQATLPEDMVKLYAGHEHALYTTLLAAVDSNAIHNEKVLCTLSTIAQQLHMQLSLPPSRAQSAINERMLGYYVQLQEDLPTNAGLLYLIVIRHLEDKTCSGAGCRAYGKQACSRCRVVRYCGQACQRNDWRVPQGDEFGVCVTHKAVCPILCKLNDAGSIVDDQSVRRFVDSFRLADLPHADFLQLVSWGVVSGVVPPSVFDDPGITQPRPST